MTIYSRLVMSGAGSGTKITHSHGQFLVLLLVYSHGKNLFSGRLPRKAELMGNGLL